MQTCTQRGFTIVEILVAIAIFGILSAVLTTTLTGNLKMNRASQTEISSATTTQRYLESVRGAWNTQTNYDRACVDGFTIPAGSGITARYQNLDSRAGNASAAADIIVGTDAAPCSAKSVTPTTPPNMRRITVTQGSTTLLLDVPRPGL